MAHDDGPHQPDEHEHGHHGTKGYAGAIEAGRADKDAYFKHAPGSPIPAAARQAFDGLPYFAVDPSLRFVDQIGRAHV